VGQWGQHDGQLNIASNTAVLSYRSNCVDVSDQYCTTEEFLKLTSVSIPAAKLSAVVTKVVVVETGPPVTKSVPNPPSASLFPQVGDVTEFQLIHRGLLIETTPMDTPLHLETDNPYWCGVGEPTSDASFGYCGQ